MPVLTKEIKIVKIPLAENERFADIPKSFPRMPQMYLELIENKGKIKPDLINKDYVPEAQKPKEDERDKDRERERDKDRERERDKDRERERDKDRGKNRNSNSSSISVSDTESISTGSSIRESDISEDSRSHSHESDSNDSRDTQDSDSSDDLTNRLKELLGEDTASSDSSHSKRKDKKNKDKYSREHKGSSGGKYTPYDKYKAEMAPAPTLKELEQKGEYKREYQMRDINHVTTAEYDEEDRKRELMFKFELLKKSYPTSSSLIPEYSIHSDLKEMQKSYEDNVKRLSLDSTVGTYKTYLIGGFSVVEFVFGNFLGFDMQGFTQQQVVNMHSYERLLIELGEKSYVPTGSKWPVELRLLGIIVINAGIFIVSKMIMKKTGANLMNMINGMNAPSPQVSKPKRRMKGPNIDINDIPDISEENTELKNEN
jgi:hypothetical protein